MAKIFLKHLFLSLTSGLVKPYKLYFISVIVRKLNNVILSENILFNGSNLTFSCSKYLLKLTLDISEHNLWENVWLRKPMIELAGSLI